MYTNMMVTIWLQCVQQYVKLRVHKLGRIMQNQIMHKKDCLVYKSIHTTVRSIMQADTEYKIQCSWLVSLCR
ncbi:unnamed protein product [Heterobilharzia americana]|nr:unnamed protein product [Heterobilharzia americana]CAH8469434.1 unnamed protein product [Heterobilharzia americana]